MTEQARAVRVPNERRRAEKKKKKEKEKDPNRIRLFYADGSIDVPMLIIMLVLLIIGITMMFSASHALAYKDSKDNDSFMYATRQIQFAGIGLVAMFFISFIDYRILRKELTLPGTNVKFTLATVFLVISMAIVTLVIPLGVSNTENGPRRWLDVPLLGKFQPSELLKFALILFLALYISKHYRKMRYFKVGILKPVLLFAVISVLIMAQPHLSCLIIMAMIMAAMLFIGGINVLPIILVIAVAIPVFMLGISLTGFDYFQERIENTFNPLADITNTTYQSYQAVLAVGSGGMWGVGFGNSTQKYGYIPEAQNDFVYAILCEEFGFVGGLMVIILFLIFVLRGFYIARKAQDRFGMMLATGITLQVGIQALLNIGVNVCAVPNTGISMPFFSYGGTALMVQLAEMGLLMSVSRRAKLN